MKKLALIRGDSLNEWEGGLWNNLSDYYEVTGFCAKKNLYKTNALHYPVRKILSVSDCRVLAQYDKFLNGRFQRMFGLEKMLNSFDIAHTAEISYFYTTQAVRAKKNNPQLKIVTTVWDNSFGRYEYNYWPFFTQPPKFWREKINNIIRENIDGVDMFLPVSEFSAEMLRDYGVPENKIKILVPAVVMPENIPDLDLLKKEINPENKELYLMVNRLVKEKGIYDVLYGFRLHLKSSGNKNKMLLVIGNGPERGNLQRLSKDLGLADNVNFIPYMPNEKLKNIYRFAKCLILGSLPGPLWQEQFGYVLAEAIISDCPVISTYSGAIPEVIGKAGILCIPGNPVSIFSAMEKMDDPHVYSVIKNNCQLEKIRFTIGGFKNQLLDCYQRVLL